MVRVLLNVDNIDDRISILVIYNSEFVVVGSLGTHNALFTNAEFFKGIEEEGILVEVL